MPDSAVAVVRFQLQRVVPTLSRQNDLRQGLRVISEPWVRDSGVYVFFAHPLSFASGSVPSMVAFVGLFLFVRESALQW